MKRSVSIVFGFFVILSMLLVACAPAATPTAAPAAATQPPAQPASGGTGMDALISAAKAEGQLTVIALPHDWCDYADVISQFKQKYGLTVNELNPDAGSGD